MVSPRGSRRGHEEDWNFPGKNLEIRMFLYCKNKLGEVSSRKKVKASNFVKIKNPTMIQMNQI